MSPLNNAGLFLVNVLFSLGIFVLLLRIVLTACKVEYYNPLFQVISRLTDLPVKIFQTFLPKVKTLDFPAIALLLVVDIIKLILFSLLIAGFPNLAGIMLWALIDIVKELINLYSYVIILFVILTWVGGPRAGVAALTLYKIAEPLLRRIRQLIPEIAGIDFSPLLVIILLQLINILLLMPLIHWSMSFALGG